MYPVSKIRFFSPGDRPAATKTEGIIRIISNKMGRFIIIVPYLFMVYITNHTFPDSTISKIGTHRMFLHYVVLSIDTTTFLVLTGKNDSIFYKLHADPDLFEYILE
jgi:hypothetical protein